MKIYLFKDVWANKDGARPYEPYLDLGDKSCVKWSSKNAEVEK